MPIAIQSMSPRALARLAGLFYLINAIVSPIGFSGSVSGWLLTTVNIVGPASYIAVAILLCYIFRPAGKYLTVVAMIFSLMGSTNEIFWRSSYLPIHLHSLVYFGCYCTLLGVLILRSKFMPHLLGYLLLLAGAGWLTFLSPHLAALCSPFNYIAGGLGEIPFMIWLLIKGIDTKRWHIQNGTQNSTF